MAAHQQLETANYSYDYF